MQTQKKRTAKEEREREVLLGLVAHHIETGHPVGSQVLQEKEFAHLSSATLRNYFVHLEAEGYLSQPYVSGGRLPTSAAYRLYAENVAEKLAREPETLLFHGSAGFSEGNRGREARFAEESETARSSSEGKQVARLLQRAADRLAEKSRCAVFLSAPRFDRDAIAQMKVVPLDASRLLLILMTEFGTIHTDTLYSEEKVSRALAHRFESYFQWRITRRRRPPGLSPREEQKAAALYEEAVVRYAVSYSSFKDEEIYKTGFSHLATNQELEDHAAVGKALAFLDHSPALRLLLRDAMRTGKLKIWIAEDLSGFSTVVPPCALLAVPYAIGGQQVGAIALLGPIRMRYQDQIARLLATAQQISEQLTRTIHKHRISFVAPPSPAAAPAMIAWSRQLLLEDHNKELPHATS